MNLKKEIIDFLNTQTNWDKLKKAYYVYIRLCEIFSYDFRYLFGTPTEQLQIYQKQLDIFSTISEFEIVCSSWCDTAQKIYQELGFDVKISYDILPHVYLLLVIEPYYIKIDPMKNGYDLTRVKIRCSTRGFQDLMKHPDFQIKIQCFANEIYGKKSINADDCIDMIQNELKKEKLWQNEIDHDFSNEQFRYKMNLISSLINHTTRVQKYDDSDRYIDYLKLKLMTEWEQYRIHKYPFWKKQDGEWKVLDLILLEQEKERSLCYKLAKEQNKFLLNPIGYDEMNYYLENYECKVKGIYRELTM